MAGVELDRCCDSYAAAFCCRGVGPNGLNNKHSLEEHLSRVGSTTSTVASLPVARLEWLLSQAKLPRHDGWRRTWQMCQWPWNVKSTIRKARPSPTQNWIALGKLVATYNFAASPLLHRSPLKTILNPASWWLSQSCDSYAAAFCCRDVGPNGPNNKHSLEEHLSRVGSTTSTVASWPVARLEWLLSQAKLPRHDGWRRTWQMCQWPWLSCGVFRAW